MELLDHIGWVVEDFANPKKRVFVGYLFLALLIAFVWLLVIKRSSLRSAFAAIFDKRVFFSRSSTADYKIFVINRVVTLFISPLLLTQLAIATTIWFALHEVDFLRAGQFADANKAVVVGLFSVTLFIADDLTKYLMHRWMHRWPMLWAIHKVHHSATTLTPVTVYRVHPLEGVLYGLRSAVAQGVTMSVFVFLFGGAVDLYTVVGVNVLVFIFHVTGSNLRHSHIQISYWPWLERLFISPAQHQIHHSVAVEHHDKNFGAALAIWDWAFGSLHLSEPERRLTFGLDAKENADDANLTSIYLRPFVEIGSIARRFVLRFVRPAVSPFARSRTRRGANPRI